MDQILNITDHARERAKKRIGLSLESLHRIALRAYTEGEQVPNAKGRRVIYGGMFFVFVDNTLITCGHNQRKARYMSCHEKRERGIL